MKILHVIVSYNFPAYLNNIVNSLKFFSVPGDIMIIDNGSDCENMLTLLAEYEKNDIAKVTSLGRNNSDSKVGSLYDANNFSIEYALSNDYDLICFYQDDLQLVHYADGLSAIKSILDSDRSISMVVPLMHKKILHKNFESRFIRRDDLGTFESRDYGVADIGVMSVDFIRRSGFRFSDSETEHSQKWFKEGYKVHFLQEAYLIYVPWVAVRRNNKVIGKEFEISDDLYIKPLSSDDMLRLKGSVKSSPIYTDDFCVPDGWTCLYPYWYTDCDPQYFKWLMRSGLKLRMVGKNKGMGLRPTGAQLLRLFVPAELRSLLRRNN